MALTLALRKANIGVVAAEMVDIGAAIHTLTRALRTVLQASRDGKVVLETVDQVLG